MARLPDLISAVAEWDDRDRATIEHFVDVLRETGYLPDAQAELPAPELRASEAATLLIALNGSDTPERGADALEAFGNLLWNPASEWDDDDPLARTLVGKPFREALAALLHHLPPVVAGSFGSGVSSPIYRQGLLG